jgi:hypothetical protein
MSKGDLTTLSLLLKRVDAPSAMAPKFQFSARRGRFRLFLQTSRWNE